MCCSPGKSTGCETRLILMFLQVLSGKQPWSEVREDAAVVLRMAQGHKPGRPESRHVDDIHWDLIEHCWSSLQERPAASAIITSIQRFLTYYPPFQPLRDMDMSDNSSLPSFDADGSSTNVGVDKDDSDRYTEKIISSHSTHVDVSGSSLIRIASLPNPSGPVRFRQSDRYRESRSRPTTLDSIEEGPYKRRRM